MCLRRGYSPRQAKSYWPMFPAHLANLLQGGLRALQEHALQVASHSVLDTRPLSLSGLHKGLCLAYLLQILVVVSFLHPLLQQGPQLTHVLETELQSLKTADSRLAEHLSWGGGLEEAK